MDRLDEIERDFAILEDVREFGNRRKLYKKRHDPFQLEDKDFYERYRFDKVTVNFLVDVLNIEQPRNNRELRTPISLQVLTTLRFLGRNVHQSDIADLHGMSQTTVGRIIKSISKRIALLLPHFISNNELSEVKSKFYEIARLSTVIGTIDCTHVRIKCPAKNVGPEMAGHFLNRKGFYSLNVQIVCDADCKIMDIVARSRGSKHDAGLHNIAKERKFSFLDTEPSARRITDPIDPENHILASTSGRAFRNAFINAHF